MYFAYLDESGDIGVTNSPTAFFVLNCVLVRDHDWLPSLDRLVDLRRQWKAKWGIPTRPEVKASEINTGKGLFRGLQLSRSSRFEILEEGLMLQAASLNLKTFSVAIEKEAADCRGWEPRNAAWTFVLQRINRFCDDKDELAKIFPDEGHGFFIRRRIRAMRRYHSVPSFWGGSSLRFEIKRIIEDPSDRSSHDSYFTQLADWNAYAAHRSSHVDPKAGTPDHLWDLLDDCLLMEVNALRGGPPAIVRYP